RVSEVLGLRLDCTGRYGGLAMLWHDQTKVGRYDQAIRIPESLSGRLAARRETTVSRFIARHGRAPTAAEREAMALSPGRYGSPSPGTLLSGPATPVTREQAQALAIDLSRRSTPADGGFCTFQPVVDGGACPWNLDCHNCASFVLSGADLLYWRRKREQWYSIAERAPDDATASWLHDVFAPTAKAIDGLEKALAGLG